ncbi:WLM-domain-containing protein [Aulographum hederae CBS 113979]|uniref:WLM-domain-containing protein n=1 Tax=Aulographum hederae CBS 113979 TaxID=1176131 RepID=A0A6G1H552_9PEZI|nr:WLM-domain-containing protein [Aulographum hederae CBS 113979]
MPLGFERLNERKKRPNPHINFIKPLAGPSSAHALDFLERIAAISLPIMRTHHINVMTLEEFPANREFVGRNFNAGEVIQLVLKAPGAGGRWLPFRHVQMVMMHELAHCKEMNHGKGFWRVRDGYAGELRGLWGRGFTGEGFWARGKTVRSGEYETERMPEAVEQAEHVCGGTFRSRRGKRKRGAGGKEREKVSYAERQQRRILRKFGTGGTALGEDEETKVKLEGGKKPKGKPRVAGSARGRELRAAAALARFDQAKEAPVKKEEQDSGSETESDYEGIFGSEARDIDGKELKDSKGHGMVKVCEDEDAQGDDARREMDELYSPSSAPSKTQPPPSSKLSSTSSKSQPSRLLDSPKTNPPSDPQSVVHPPSAPISNSDPSVCKVCSLVNEPNALTCAACANVLDPSKLPRTWKCGSLACEGGVYINSDDANRCGVCGGGRP